MYLKKIRATHIHTHALRTTYTKTKMRRKRKITTKNCEVSNRQHKSSNSIERDKLYSIRSFAFSCSLAPNRLRASERDRTRAIFSSCLSLSVSDCRFCLFLKLFGVFTCYSYSYVEDVPSCTRKSARSRENNYSFKVLLGTRMCVRNGDCGSHRNI